MDLSYQSIAEVAVSHTLHVTFIFGTDFLVGKKIQLPSFRDCLKECGTVQMLTVGREAAIEVQVCLYKYFQAIINMNLIDIFPQMRFDLVGSNMLL